MNTELSQNMTRSHEAGLIQTMAYLNPPGTFTEQAGKIAVLDPRYADYTLTGVDTIEGVIHGVRDGTFLSGSVPIENCTAGDVKNTNQAFLESDGIRITKEIVLPIHHYLWFSNATDPKYLSAIASKDQALEQCKDYLTNSFPHAERLPVKSTSEAVLMAAESPTLGAIGSQNAADALGVSELLTYIPWIEDNPNNATTFVVLEKGNENQPWTGRDKTTYMLTMNDNPGSLLAILEQLADQGINLTKIKSLRRQDGAVTFLLSIDGHEEDNNVQSAYTAHKTIGAEIKSFGSYPKADYTLPTEPDEKLDMEKAIHTIKQEVGNGDNTEDTICIFALRNEAGSLRNALRPFVEQGINLTKIDSQPTGIKDAYYFYLAFHANTAVNLDDVLKKAANACTKLLVLNRSS